MSGAQLLAPVTCGLNRLSSEGRLAFAVFVHVKEDDRCAFGYANGIVSYLPTAAEYAFGGYECDDADQSCGLLLQVGPESEAVLVEGSLELLGLLWS